MGSHVSRWYRQLFELSLNGFRRLCNGTNGAERGEGGRAEGDSLATAGEAPGPGAGVASLPPGLRILLMFFELRELTRTFQLLITSLGSLGSRPL